MQQSKDEAFRVFKKYKALVEKETEHKLKVLRTDRGGEFLSQQFQSFCDEAGIQRHLTAPYTPQQNGVVERRNRTVVAMARSLLKNMLMPAKLWGEAVRHAVYLLNRVPTKEMTGITPYEAWTGRKPYLEHLRVFGCVAHMKVPSAHTQKLDDRSKVMVYLGVEPGSKAHCLYDPILDRERYMLVEMLCLKKAGNGNGEMVPRQILTLGYRLPSRVQEACLKKMFRWRRETWSGAAGARRRTASCRRWYAGCGRSYVESYSIQGASTEHGKCDGNVASGGGNTIYTDYGRGMK